MSHYHPTVETYRPGAHTLPGQYYTSSEVFAEERERLFAHNWICIGREADWDTPGRYKLVEIAGESIIVLRDQSGTMRAFFNLCRHRGTRLCEAAHGTLSETIQCPYHAWTYALDGRLIGAPHMQEAEEFDKADYPLHQVALDAWEGFLFVNLDRHTEPLATAFQPMIGRFARFNLGALLTVATERYEVGANWKLILQNYNECLHCPTIHPELSAKLPYTSGANDLVEGPFLGGYMEIKAPYQSATMSGKACARPLGNIGLREERRAFYYALFPTMMLSLHPDYAVYYTVIPRSPVTSTVTCEWMVHRDAPSSPDYNLADAREFWDRTNRQDWHICEQSQLGVTSRAYVPGPYSPRESIPAAWDREYLRRMSA